MAVDPRVAHWFATRRGIRPETTEAFGVYTEDNDLVFPYPEGLLKRRYSVEDAREINPFGLEKEGRRFVWRDADGGPAGAGQVPFLPPDFKQAERMIVCEGETDTMALWQALPEKIRPLVSVVGLSGLNAWKSRYVDELFTEAKRVFVVLDNDDPYTSPDAHAAGEKAWLQIRGDLGKKARKVTLPQGTNDLAEFLLAYDWAAFEVLLKAAAQPVRHYQPIDWSKPVPETDWLMRDSFAMAEVTTFAGDSGLGKSFLVSALGLALVSGAETFLARELFHQGRPVMYIDEENSETLIRQRLSAMGIKPEHHELFQYFVYPGINLFENPGPLIEQAIDTEPSLIVLDSLSSLSIGAVERDEGDMTRLFKEAIRPLARESGAAVVVLHHTTKDGLISRGSGAIKAQSDNLLTGIKTESNGVLNDRINIFGTKERRLLEPLTSIEIVGDIEHDGWVRVQLGGDPEAM